MYQENCYMLGRVFSNEPLTPTADTTVTTDELLKETADELALKDLKDLERELMEGENSELKAMLIDSI